MCYEFSDRGGTGGVGGAGGGDIGTDAFFFPKVIKSSAVSNPPTRARTLKKVSVEPFFVEHDPNFSQSYETRTESWTFPSFEKSSATRTTRLCFFYLVIT